jgi:hypothetical protein
MERIEVTVMNRTGLQIIKMAVSAMVVVSAVGIGIGLSMALAGTKLPPERKVYRQATVIAVYEVAYLQE